MLAAISCSVLAMALKVRMLTWWSRAADVLIVGDGGLGTQGSECLTPNNVQSRDKERMWGCLHLDGKNFSDIAEAVGYESRGVAHTVYRRDARDQARHSCGHR